MRFKQFVQQDQDQLNEINLKQAVAAGLIGAASMGIGTKAQALDPQTQYRQDLAQSIAKHYRVDDDMVAQVIELAHKYQKPTWPRAQDLIALVGVESSFNPKAVSGLKKDPAMGVLQVRPGVWKIPRESLNNLENQMKHGAEVLHYYYKKFRGDKEAALSAYNLGETRFRREGENPRYLNKYYTELERQKQARVAEKERRLRQQHKELQARRSQPSALSNPQYQQTAQKR